MTTPAEDGSKPNSEIESMRRALMIAKIYFQNHFKDPEAVAFAEKRGISAATARKFELGYSPVSWRGLVEHYSYHPVRLAAQKAGLLTEQANSKRLLDFFRGRLMFPIKDLSGSIVGFGGRIVEKLKDEAKYYNSPETLLFNKSEVLFGAFQHAAQIAALKEVILVEGYLDVTSLSTNGFDYSVAPMGTALTPQHVDILLGMGVKKFWIGLDGDSAGRSAAQRSIQVLMEKYHPTFEIMIIEMPDGEDPDSIIKNGGQAAFQAVMDKAVPLIEHIHQVCCEGFPPRPGLEDKATYLLRIEPYIEMSSGFLEAKLIDQASKFSGLPPQDIHWSKVSYNEHKTVAQWHRLVMLAARWMVHEEDPVRIANRVSKMTAQGHGVAELVELAKQIVSGAQPDGLMFEFTTSHGALTDYEFSDLHENWSLWVKQVQLSEAVEQVARAPFDEGAKQTIRVMLLR